MDLLEEAKLRYPIGTRFNAPRGAGANYQVLPSDLFKQNSDGAICIRTSGNGTVYFDGKWAKIIEYKIPDKWCIKVNSSYNDYLELYNWRKDSWKNSGYIDSDKVWMPTKRDSYTEIRIEDFIKYIYKGEEKKENSSPKYVKCIKNDIPSYKYGEVNKIYKVKNWNHSYSDCIIEGSNCGSSAKDRFIPSTYEEYCVQENINVVPVKEEENLIGRYVKLVKKGHSNDGYYYLVTDKNSCTRLKDNVQNCVFGSLTNWEIMPKDFEYTGQDNVPQYVKCVESWHSVWTTDKVYKTEKEQLDFPNTLRVKDDKGEVIKVYSWDAPKTFKISTEEEYLAQQAPIENVKKEEIMEDLTGRWLKALTDYPQCTKPKKGDYIQIRGKYINNNYEVELFDTYGADPSKKELWELMPIGFSPNTKEECSKEYMPKYVEWVDNLGGGRCGKMCLDAYLEKGKIFDTSNDGILPNNCGNSWKKLWQFYYYNFTESTEKEYDAQNNIIRVKMPDTSSTGIKGTNPWLIDEVGHFNRYWNTGSTIGEDWGIDTYKSEKKTIEEIALPKPKERLVF